MNLLEDIFQPYGQVPWDDLINPLWAELVSHVEEAWLALDSGFMHQDEERLPLAFLPGAIAFPPPLDCDEVATYKQEFPRAPLSPPPDSASTPISGAEGVSGDCRVTGYRRLSSSACNALPALAGGIRLLVYVLPISRSSLSSAVPVLFTHTDLFIRRSVFYPRPHFVAHLVACLHSSVDCCRNATQIGLSPRVDTSAWVEIFLALVGDHIVAY